MRRKDIYQINIFAVIVLTTLGGTLLAEQDTEVPIEASKNWTFELTPYFWAAELDGDATLRGRTGPAEASFSDLADKLDIAFMGCLEAWKGG